MTAFVVQPEHYDVARLRGHCGGPSWDIEPTRTALLAHDLQPHYLHPLSAQARRFLLTQATRVLAWADDHQVPVLASGPRPASHLTQRGLLGTCWGMGLSPAQAAQVALPRLAAADVTRIAKRSYSAFYASDLETELRRRGCDQLIVIGVYASHGILATSLDAVARDIQTFVAFDATADYTARRHAAALDLIATMSGRVLAGEDLLRVQPAR
ncbi:isochorismatase family protein [Streptomyces sp. NPDC101151]|uniref:isochorismatase family protein n=1 Tax=Streptomyces sp. NPDC101151 TaxID=3366115 RepID=UPI0037F15A69